MMVILLVVIMISKLRYWLDVTWSVWHREDPQLRPYRIAMKLTHCVYAKERSIRHAKFMLILPYTKFYSLLKIIIWCNGLGLYYLSNWLEAAELLTHTPLNLRNLKVHHMPDESVHITTLYSICNIISHLNLGLSSDILPSSFRTKQLYIFPVSPIGLYFTVFVRDFFIFKITNQQEQQIRSLSPNEFTVFQMSIEETNSELTNMLNLYLKFLWMLKSRVVT